MENAEEEWGVGLFVLSSVVPFHFSVLPSGRAMVCVTILMTSPLPDAYIHKYTSHTLQLIYNKETCVTTKIVFIVIYKLQHAETFALHMPPVALRLPCETKGLSRSSSKYTNTLDPKLAILYHLA